jgi:hypothetical protein
MALQSAGRHACICMGCLLLLTETQLVWHGNDMVASQGTHAPSGRRRSAVALNGKGCDSFVHAPAPPQELGEDRGKHAHRHQLKLHIGRSSQQALATSSVHRLSFQYFSKSCRILDLVCPPYCFVSFLSAASSRKLN